MAKDLTTGSPTRLILSYSVPLLIGNIFQQLYSMVDTIIVGKCIGVDALAAVGATGGLSFLILGFLMGLTGGFAVITAQKYGAKDMKELRHSVGTSIILCIFTTIILTVLSLLTAKPLLKVMNTPDNIMADAHTYISIIFIGIACTVFYNMIACVLRAIGDSKTPLYFLIVSSILNIVLDLVFILSFHMGVAGAAWATVISQGVAGLLCLLYTKKKYSILKLTKQDFAYNGKFAWKHWQLGLPMALQFSVTAIGVLVLQSALNLFGSTKIAAYTAACKVEQLVTQPAGTFGVTMANYAGQNLGAGRIDRVKEGLKKCSVITVLFALGASAILLLFGKPLTMLFIDTAQSAAIQNEVLSSANIYLTIIAIFLPVLNMLFVYRNVLQGIGRSFMPFMAGVFELVARTICAFTLPAVMGFTGICLAGPIAWLAATIPLAFAYHIVIKKFD
ncbi:MATE family efflux transporter [Anaerosporobacter faecicola]|uniref:MATE family efflux transporter n=1 Tax=Anaerosporobacter faecicola TaxID=2718714 RepID=UPI00143B88A0|nr:MATE family efflux transporter [Anaerosporobacter faecicola]